MVENRSSVSRRKMVLSGVAAAGGLAGCTDHLTEVIGAPSESEPLRIGVLAPEGVAVGGSIVDATEVAVAQINDDGGIAGRDVDHTVERLGHDPDVAAAHRRLCRTEGCHLTLGLFRERSVRGILDSVADEETVHLTTGSLAGSPSAAVADAYERYKYHSRVGPPGFRSLGRALGEFVDQKASEYGWSEAALVTEDLHELTPYHEAVLEHASRTLDVTYDARLVDSSVDPVLADIEALDCDVVLVGWLLSGATFVNQWAKRGRPFDLGGFHLPGTRSEFYERTGGNAESLFTMNALAPGSENTPRTADFVSAYRDRVGTFPLYSGATTFDAIRLYRAVVEEATDETGRIPGQEAIVERMRQTTYTEGTVYPALSFTGPDAERAHEPVWRSMAESGVPVVQRWEPDGSVTVVSTEG